MDIVKSFGKLMAKRRKAMALVKASIMLQKGIEKAENIHTAHRFIYLLKEKRENCISAYKT